MTPAQKEAMDAVAHMTPKEIQEFAAMLMTELELKLKRDAVQKAIDRGRAQRLIGNRRNRLDRIR